ncbi:MAG: hypothetical protein ACRDFS_13725, partial [Chloroflexota bacterium]
NGWSECPLPLDQTSLVLAHLLARDAKACNKLSTTVFNDPHFELRWVSDPPIRLVALYGSGQFSP